MRAEAVHFLQNADVSSLTVEHQLTIGSAAQKSYAKKNPQTALKASSLMSVAHGGSSHPAAAQPARVRDDVLQEPLAASGSDPYSVALVSTPASPVLGGDSVAMTDAILPLSAPAVAPPSFTHSRSMSSEPFSAPLDHSDMQFPG